MRALNTIGPRGPRIAFATSRKGPQARLLAYTPRRETQPVLWQSIPVGETARKGGVGERTFCSRCRNTQPDSQDNKQHATHSSEHNACRQHFLCENEQSETNDPHQVHDASIKQEGH